MPFVLIEGTYHVQGFQPDGDSVRFRPLDPEADWARIPGRRPRLNSRGMAQLRLEGIDALETHFAAGGALGTVHQPTALADAARDRLLELLGVTGVVLAPNGRTIVAAADGTPGYILTREVEMNGRPVSFAYAGAPPAVPDPSDVFLDAAMLAGSANRALLAEGLAYPIYYTTLFDDLREDLTAAVAAARAAGLGVWPDDRTGGLAITDLADMTDRHPILPKLFRRLTSYFAANGGLPDVTGFVQSLAAENERVIVIGSGRTTGFDNVVTVDDGSNTVALTVDPTSLVFVPRQFVPQA